MSYCRWSSMNWRCDVYVYESCSGGWMTHVAGRRRAVPPIPDLPLSLVPNFGGTWNQETREFDYPTRWRKVAARMFFGFWAWWHNRIHMGSLHLIPLRPIGLPHDGESFNDDTPGECAERLQRLRQLGYIVPQRTIDALLAEDADGVVGQEGAA